MKVVNIKVRVGDKNIWFRASVEPEDAAFILSQVYKSEIKVIEARVKA